MEEAAGVPLSWFFDQWLKRPGMPSVRGGWHYDAAAKSVQIDLEQTQSGDPYRLPMDIAIAGAAGTPRIEHVELTAATGRFTFAAEAEPSAVTLDPDSWVLMQVEAFVRR